MRQLGSVVIFVLAATVSAYPQCSSPRYRIGRVLQDNIFGTTLQISVGVQDLAPQRLICLAQEFRGRYHDRARIEILIFSNHEAAKRWIVPSADAGPQRYKWNSYLHGAYIYDAAVHDEHLSIDPDQVQATFDSTLSTTLTLPVEGSPRCKVQLDTRCLLVLPHIWPFQGEHSNDKASGSVTLAGKVAADGKIKGVRAVESHLTPDEAGDFLKKMAIQNLKAWRFESAPHSDIIQVTYEYRFNYLHDDWRMPVRMGQPGKPLTEFNVSLSGP